jgi:hypothetical protein
MSLNHSLQQLAVSALTSPYNTWSSHHITMRSNELHKSSNLTKLVLKMQSKVQPKWSKVFKETLRQIIPLLYGIWLISLGWPCRSRSASTSMQWNLVLLSNKSTGEQCTPWSDCTDWYGSILFAHMIKVISLEQSVILLCIQ